MREAEELPRVGSSEAEEWVCAETEMETVESVGMGVWWFGPMALLCFLAIILHAIKYLKYKNESLNQNDKHNIPK